MTQASRLQTGGQIGSGLLRREAKLANGRAALVSDPVPPFGGRKEASAEVVQQIGCRADSHLPGFIITSKLDAIAVDVILAVMNVEKVAGHKPLLTLPGNGRIQPFRLPSFTWINPGAAKTSGANQEAAGRLHFGGLIDRTYRKGAGEKKSVGGNLDVQDGP
jgi:hypothetical protein